VFILLSIFLEFRLAFWVTMGIPISFLGSLLIIPKMDVSINMISLFAFIITLGIVVDDAIVVGENIYSYRQKGEKFLNAAIKGARQIAIPVTFSVLTNIVAFLPMYFVPGFMGKIFRVIPVVVISVYVISLIESLFILPAHIGHLKNNPNNFFLNIINKYQQKVSNGFIKLINNVYKPSLKFSLRFRYITIAIGIFILIVTLAFVKSGRMGFALFPKIEADFAYVSFKLPFGTPPEKTKEVANYLEKSAEKIINEFPKGSLSKGILTDINENSCWMMVLLTEPEIRPIGTDEFIKRWRKLAGQIPGIESIKFESDKGGPGSGAALSIELRHKDIKILEQASAELAKSLSYYPIVSDIDDGFMPGKTQFDIKLNELGYSLGLTPKDVATQIRNSYYGAEALKQLRLRNEIKVVVKLDRKERESEKFFEDFIIFTPSGGQVLLSDIAEVTKGHSYTSINRRNGKRIVVVTSDVTPQSKTGEVVSALLKDVLPKLAKKYPGLTYGFEGKQSDRRNSLRGLGIGMIFAILAIYALLAIPFKSYIQPMIIMISIPFGIVGAIAGHLIMGYNLSILSMFGIVALSGIVVNDSLVLIDATNKKIKEKFSPYYAITEAATSRFRPIILTTMTTFFGLLPIIFEQSRQARFLIPMAISLGFGVLFSTLIILILVPALYIVLEDVKGFFK
jgi:multidrug efflux pump subunit AcrB